MAVTAGKIFLQDAIPLDVISIENVVLVKKAGRIIALFLSSVNKLFPRGRRILMVDDKKAKIIGIEAVVMKPVLRKEIIPLIREIPDKKSV